MNHLLNILREEKETQNRGGIYHKIQIEMTYNSNRMEGSMISREQTESMYDSNTIDVTTEPLKVDDIVETANHFRCIDYVIDNVKKPLKEDFIKELHYMLKNGTSDSRKDWFSVGDYKQRPNKAGKFDATLPENVTEEMSDLLRSYGREKKKSLAQLLEYHYRFETIHPFQDGNGRVGRLILLKECLRNNIVPFIINDDYKWYYYRGLREWEGEKGYLTDTCLAAQDRFKSYLDYYKIDY